MYEGMSHLMIAEAKAGEVAAETVGRALASAREMTHFHKVLMFDDLHKVGRRLSNIHGTFFDSIERDFVAAVMNDTMEGLRRMGYRDIEGHKAMDGDVVLGYAIEFNEPFNYTV